MATQVCHIYLSTSLITDVTHRRDIVYARMVGLGSIAICLALKENMAKIARRNVLAEMERVVIMSQVLPWF